MSVGSPRRCILIACSCLLLLPAAAAQAPSDAALWDQQQWDFGVWAGEAIGQEDTFNFGHVQVTQAGVHIGRVFHRASPDSGRQTTWEYTLDLQPLLLVTRPRLTYGGGFAPVGVKWNLTPHGRYRPYIEFNGGCAFTQKNVPPGRTSDFNFTAALGPGVMMRLSQKQAMSIALRWWHLSNGGIGDYNPSFNTIEFVVGYHWLKLGHGTRQQLSGTTPGTQAKE
jgi:hypothetical protein